MLVSTQQNCFNINTDGVIVECDQTEQNFAIQFTYVMLVSTQQNCFNINTDGVIVPSLACFT
jgi:hypothetical protein